MKNDNRIFPWCFPCNFFMFLSFFLTVKFIFIFFLNGFYEPEFIFNLTPFHLFPSLNYLQLLFLSYLFVIFDLFLHLNPTHNNLRISFFPTLFLILGTGLYLTTNQLSIGVLPYLIIFFCLLLVMLIDNKFILEFEDLDKITPEVPVKDKKIVEKPVYIGRPKPSKFKFLKELFATIKKQTVKTLSQLKKPVIKTKTSEWKEVKPKGRSLPSSGRSLPSSSRFKDFEDSDIDISSDEDFSSVTNLVDEKLENLDKRLKELQNEEIIPRKIRKPEKQIIKKPKEAKIKPKSITSKDNTNMLKEINESAFVVKKGILKDVNEPFRKDLGYSKDDVLDKNLIDFISLEGLSGLEDYYFNRLKHKAVKSFETVLLTKDNKKVPVKIEIRSRIINGEKVDIAVIKKEKK